MKPIGNAPWIFGFGDNNNKNKEGGMCRLLGKNKLILSLFALASLVGSQMAYAQTITCENNSNIGIDAYCRTNADGTVDLSSQITTLNVIPGQTIFYQARLRRNVGDCALAPNLGTWFVVTPDGQSNNVTPAGGFPRVCGAPDGITCFTNALFTPAIPYKVRAQDIGNVNPNIAGCGAGNNKIQGATYLNGIFNECGIGSGLCPADNQIGACNTVLIPTLVVEKAVACTTGQVCDASLAYSSSASGAKDSNTNPKFCYRFIYRNTGTAGLAITSAVDNVLGAVSFPAGLPPAGQPLSVITNFSGVTEHASTVTDTLIVLATQTAQGCFSTSIVAQASATATVVNTPISCDVVFRRDGANLNGNVCPGSTQNIGVLPGANIDVRVFVNNTGGNGQSIENVSVLLSGVPGGPLGPQVIVGPITAGNSGSTTFSAVIPGSIGSFNNVRADITAEGVTTDVCPPLDTVCSNSIVICGTNCIDIVKLVKCVDVDECLAQQCGGDLSEYSERATGVKDAAFCYAITVTNCGQLAFDRVVVTDPVLVTGGAPNPILTLQGTGIFPSGASTTIFVGPVSYPGFVSPPDKINTASVLGTNAQGTAEATDDASVTLLNPAIMCTKQVSLNAGPYTSGGTIEVPFDSINSLTFRVIVKNNGNVDLVNVKVIDTGTSGCGLSTNMIASLPIGASVTNEVCTVDELTCPPSGASVRNVVNVEAEVSSNVCSINPADCKRVKTSSTCENTITLTCVPPGACRTTGGGKQPAEDTCPEVRYVTHGGQVGASYGVAGAPDCAQNIGFNNVCIRGEYQHVRHIKGGLRGTFHAAGNGNQHDFDSLMCACLPCEFTETASPFGGCHPADRTYVADSTSPGKKHDLCHPDERECGPEPRRAPANKICFSGVADYTMSNGKKDPQSVVFRVDLEDRSEPGGAHPKGGKAPPDRYRMRMWFISSGSADTAAVKALRATVACKDATDEKIPRTLDCVGGATPAPNIDDGGDLDRGNRQIHPSTGASCK